MNLLVQYLYQGEMSHNNKAHHWDKYFLTNLWEYLKLDLTHKANKVSIKYMCSSLKSSQTFITKNSYTDFLISLGPSQKNVTTSINKICMEVCWVTLAPQETKIDCIKRVKRVKEMATHQAHFLPTNTVCWEPLLDSHSYFNCILWDHMQIYEAIGNWE